MNQFGELARAISENRICLACLKPYKVSQDREDKCPNCNQTRKEQLKIALDSYSKLSQGGHQAIIIDNHLFKTLVCPLDGKNFEVDDECPSLLLCEDGHAWEFKWLDKEGGFFALDLMQL